MAHHWNNNSPSNQALRGEVAALLGRHGHGGARPNNTNTPVNVRGGVNPQQHQSPLAYLEDACNTVVETGLGRAKDYQPILAGGNVRAQFDLANHLVALIDDKGNSFNPRGSIHRELLDAHYSLNKFRSLVRSSLR